MSLNSARCINIWFVSKENRPVWGSEFGNTWPNIVKVMNCFQAYQPEKLSGHFATFTQLGSLSSVAYVTRITVGD